MTKHSNEHEGKSEGKLGSHHAANAAASAWAVTHVKKPTVCDQYLTQARHGSSGALGMAAPQALTNYVADLSPWLCTEQYMKSGSMVMTNVNPCTKVNPCAGIQV